MKTNRFALCWLLLGASVAFVSCSDIGPVAPRSINAPSPSFSKGQDKDKDKGQDKDKDNDKDNDKGEDKGKSKGKGQGQILACSPLPYVTVSKIIGKEGGTITFGPHTLTIPAGALSDSVNIRATAPSENYNHIDLQPEGLKFSKPATLTMGTANCAPLDVPVPLMIAYTDDKLRIFYFLPSVQDLLQKKVSSPLDHFSDYAVAW